MEMRGIIVSKRATDSPPIFNDIITVTSVEPYVVHPDIRSPQQEKCPWASFNRYLCPRTKAALTVEHGVVNLKSMLDDNEFRERSLRSFLDIAILARLEDKPANGYSLTAFFMKKFGVIMSTSTVYSTLYAMERSGLIRCRRSWRGRVYELTEKGKKMLKDNRSRLEEAQSFIKTLIGK